MIVATAWLLVAEAHDVYRKSEQRFSRFTRLESNEVMVAVKLSGIAMSGELWRWLEVRRKSWQIDCH